MRAGPVSTIVHWHGLFSRTRGLFLPRFVGPQVLGAEVPSFRNFPYCACEVLYLYRHFLQLIAHHHAPEERKELLFRLRREFLSRRHLRGHRPILAALRRGQGILALQRQILDGKGTRRRGLASREKGAASVDGLWEQLQLVSGHKLPGLRNYEDSLPISNGRYTTQATSDRVYSRRR
ncbi:unnamed protein product [Phytomonas sp. Hart1]|nr:unnamed protein product [Phytomonas sp. Hart1]|eukprot:CCW69333.1 unnamed protein product [Phytomonas sp. isolate Hart1]